MWRVHPLWCASCMMHDASSAWMRHAHGACTVRLGKKCLPKKRQKFTRQKIPGLVLAVFRLTIKPLFEKI